MPYGRARVASTALKKGKKKEVFMAARWMQRVGLGLGVLVLGSFWACGGRSPDREKGSRKQTTTRAVLSSQGRSESAVAGTVKEEQHELEAPSRQTSTGAKAIPSSRREVEARSAVTYEEAESTFFAGKYEEAEKLFTAYTDGRPENPWGYYMLGLSAWKAGELDRAEKALSKALALDPGHVKSRLNLARVLLDDRRPEEALGQVHSVLEIDSTSGDGYRLEGRALHQLGRTQEALASYRRALAVDPEDAWSMNNMALILIEEGRFEDALPCLARAAELRPDVAIIWNNLGMALEHRGRFHQARHAFEKAVEVGGGYEKALANLERLEAAKEDEDIEPIDLDSLADEFALRLERWAEEPGSNWDEAEAQPDSEVAARTKLLGPTTAPPDTVVVSHADSTTSAPER